MVDRAKLPQKGAPFRSIATVPCGQRKHYPIPVRCGDHMKLGVPSAPCLSDGLRTVFFKAPVPSGCTLDTGGIQAHNIHLDLDDSHLLQTDKRFL